MGLEEELEKEFKVLVDKGYKFFIVDLKTDEILNLMELEEFDEVLIFNTRSKSNVLRNKLCHENLFHVAPSNAILADALTQYLVKKMEKNGFW